MRLRLLSLFLVIAAALPAAEYPQMGPDIYDTQADAAADIETALARAKAENKRVLLDFGANWCVWCHRLHTLFTTNEAVAARLAADYVVVMVDMNARGGKSRNTATNERYGNPIQHGLPVLVVLDAAGNLLTTQETGALENGPAHDPAKVLAFLQRWAPEA